MAITINGVEYDEADLDNNVKNSIAQVQNANANIASLQADLLNQQIIAQHHSKFIQDNLPEIEDGETPTEAADVGSGSVMSEKQGERFNEILGVIKQLHDAKRHDYGNDDIFANFRLSEMAGISPWKGSVIRMGDKYARISNFIKKGDFQV